MQLNTPSAPAPYNAFDNAFSFDEPVTAKKSIEVMTDFQDDIIEAFMNFRDQQNAPKSQQLIRSQIYLYLAIYAKIEDEVFYPAIKQALIDKHLLPELQLTFDPLIESIKHLDFNHPDDALHEKNIYDLERYFLHYIKAQRIEMFVKAEKLGLNTVVLGDALQKHKHKLLNESSNTELSFSK